MVKRTDKSHVVFQQSYQQRNLRIKRSILTFFNFEMTRKLLIFLKVLY
jgi:hypothetical protein